MTGATSHTAAMPPDGSRRRKGLRGALPSADPTNAFLSGLSPNRRSNIADIVGGEKRFEDAVRHVSATASPAETEQLRKDLDGDSATVIRAADKLTKRYDAMRGPLAIKPEDPSKTTDLPLVGDALAKAFRDPRYKSDPTFRDGIYKRVAAKYGPLELDGRPTNTLPNLTHDAALKEADESIEAATKGAKPGLHASTLDLSDITAKPLATTKSAARTRPIHVAEAKPTTMPDAAPAARAKVKADEKALKSGIEPPTSGKTHDPASEIQAEILKSKEKTHEDGREIDKIRVSARKKALDLYNEYHKDPTKGDWSVTWDARREAIEAGESAIRKVVQRREKEKRWRDYLLKLKKEQSASKKPILKVDGIILFNPSFDVGKAIAVRGKYLTAAEQTDKAWEKLYTHAHKSPSGPTPKQLAALRTLFAFRQKALKRAEALSGALAARSDDVRIYREDSLKKAQAEAPSAIEAYKRLAIDARAHEAAGRMADAEALRERRGKIDRYLRSIGIYQHLGKPNMLREARLSILGGAGNSFMDVFNAIDALGDALERNVGAIAPYDEKWVRARLTPKRIAQLKAEGVLPKKGGVIVFSGKTVRRLQEEGLIKHSWLIGDTKKRGAQLPQPELRTDWARGLHTGTRFAVDMALGYKLFKSIAADGVWTVGASLNSTGGHIGTAAGQLAIEAGFSRPLPRITRTHPHKIDLSTAKPASNDTKPLIRTDRATTIAEIPDDVRLLLDQILPATARRKAGKGGPTPLGAHPGPIGERTRYGGPSDRAPAGLSAMGATADGKGGYRWKKAKEVMAEIKDESVLKMSRKQFEKKTGWRPRMPHKEFLIWWENIKPDELRRVMADEKLEHIRKSLEGRIRGRGRVPQKGGWHEYYMVTELPKLKELGVSFDKIRSYQYRTMTRKTVFKDALSETDNGVRYIHSGETGAPTIKPGTVGKGVTARKAKDVSDDAHYRLSIAIQESGSEAELNQKIRIWAEDWLENGVADLPDGLR